jgi:hypothetical protein
MKYLLLLLFTASTSGTFAQRKASGSATEQFVLQLHEAKFRWMENRQLDSLNSILDDRIQYIHSNGWIQTKQEMINDLKSKKSILNSVTNINATARMYQGFVIVNGSALFRYEIDGKPGEAPLIYTEVYARRAAGWLLVSRHACRIPAN